MPTWAIELPPKGGKPTQTRRRQKLYERCIHQLKQQFYGYNVVAVSCRGFSQKTAEAVSQLFWKHNWRVSFHDFRAADLFGRCRYLLPEVNDHDPELWFSGADATAPGFNHFSSGLSFKGLSVRCPRTALEDLQLKFQKLAGEFPALLIPTRLTQAQALLYRQCIQQLETQYHGFNRVKVDLEGAPEDIKVVHKALLELGWIHDDGIGFRTYNDVFSPPCHSPWAVGAPYLGRPEQVLFHKCARVERARQQSELATKRLIKRL